MKIAVLAVAGLLTVAGASEAAAQCHAKSAAGNRGALIGGVGGAVLGGAVAGNGAKTEGAVLGGLVGAVAGNQINRRRVDCVGECRTRTATNSRGKRYSYRVCRGDDGRWYRS